MDVSKADISSLSWTRIPRGYQLGIKTRAGSNVKFSGFREQVNTLKKFLGRHFLATRPILSGPEHLPYFLAIAPIFFAANRTSANGLAHLTASVG